jgi:hypothetical protein
VHIPAWSMYACMHVCVYDFVLETIIRERMYRCACVCVCVCARVS